MQVLRRNALAVVQDDHLAVTVAHADRFHHPVSRGVYRCPDRIREVEPGVKLRFPCPWGEARANPRRYFAFDRHGSRDRGDQALELASERGEASFQLLYGEVAVEG